MNINSVLRFSSELTGLPLNGSQFNLGSAALTSSWIVPDTLTPRIQDSFSLAKVMSVVSERRGRQKALHNNWFVSGDGGIFHQLHADKKVIEEKSGRAPVIRYHFSHPFLDGAFRMRSVDGIYEFEHPDFKLGPMRRKNTFHTQSIMRSSVFMRLPAIHDVVAIVRIGTEREMYAIFVSTRFPDDRQDKFRKYSEQDLKMFLYEKGMVPRLIPISSVKEQTINHRSLIDKKLGNPKLDVVDLPAFARLQAQKARYYSIVTNIGTFVISNDFGINETFNAMRNRRAVYLTRLQTTDIPLEVFDCIDDLLQPKDAYVARQEPFGNNLRILPASG